MPKFSMSEKKLKELFPVSTTFTYNYESYTVLECGKPTCAKGEPKTDVYILASSSAGSREFKISFKQTNAHFIENKTTAERAELILGSDWKEIIKKATLNIQDNFASRPLIYKKNYKHTENGSITLGWRYELLKVNSGSLSGVVQLTKEQVMDVYAGINLPSDKKHASVNGKIIENSGVANYILIDDNISDAQSVIDRIVNVEEYVKEHPVVYFACKALNYRTFRKKLEGNRALSVYVDWNVVNGKLDATLNFEEPLLIKGNSVADKLLKCLKELAIDNTDDINCDNVTNPDIIIE